nr:cadherin-like beta sandwich domain-containing protein [Lysinibacillus timonensis]
MKKKNVVTYLVIIMMMISLFPQNIVKAINGELKEWNYYSESNDCVEKVPCGNSDWEFSIIDESGNPTGNIENKNDYQGMGLHFTGEINTIATIKSKKGYFDLASYQIRGGYTTFELVGYKDGSPVEGAVIEYTSGNGVGGTYAPILGNSFLNVDELRFKVKADDSKILDFILVAITLPEPPTVTTNALGSISSTEAEINGQIRDHGTAMTNEHGFVYSTSSLNPTIDDNNSIRVKVGEYIYGPFQVILNNLLPNTKYYYRAYAINSAGTSYGNVDIFTTAQPEVQFPLVTTNPHDDITKTGVQLFGIVNNNGNDNLIDRGFVYSTSSNPEIDTINSVKVSVSQTLETGPYSTYLDNLNPNTTYYYRAYAENSKGFGYGEASSFTTLKNNDANLINLTLSPTGLNENFVSNQLDYSASVPSGTSSVTISATASDMNAKIRINNGETSNYKIDNQEVTLEEDGSTEIPILVTAENGTDQKIYTIVVTENAVPLNNVTSVQLSDAGIASWAAVENANNYEVQLYKGEIALGESIVTNHTDHNFLGEMRDAGVGEYTVTVIAKGNNSFYSDSTISEKSNSQTVIKLDTVTGLTWDKGIAKWSPLLNANSYDVQLYKANETIGNIENVIPFEINFIEKINQNGFGLYKYIVSAKGDNKLILDGTPSEFSDQIVASKVTYDGNGNDSGDVPTDDKVYVQGVSITLAGNDGNLVKSGYRFAGWNTSANGEGTNYEHGDSFDMNNENVTLYAQWEVYEISKPILEVHGDQNIYLEVGENFIESGYFAIDNEDGDLTNEVTVTGAVNENILGRYEVKYNVEDSDGNIADEVTRTVQVVSPKLHTLTVSAGELVPTFDPNEDSYTLSVPFDTETLTINASTLDPTASVNVNDTVIGSVGTVSIPINSGSNTVTLLVTAQGGITKAYSLVVTKEIKSQPPSSDNNGGGSSGGRDSAPSKDPQPVTEEITVPVEMGNVGSGSTVALTPIKRTTEPNGKVTDDVILTPERAKQSIQSIVESGQSTARIVIPDEQDKVSEVKVTVPIEAKQEIEQSNINLEIYTENVRILVPQQSLANFNEELYFNLVPIKEEAQRVEVESRARVEAIVREFAGDDSINVVARPMTIETNMQSRPVTLILPLRDVVLPTDEKEREAFLADLVIFIEHSDGEKELIKPEVVQYKDGQLGLEFGVTKFSTFTILDMEGYGELQKPTDETEHNLYIIGYGQEFRPNAPVSRGQMATMLARNLNEAPSIKLYADIRSTHWAYQAIMEVKGAGIMTGRNVTTFDSNGNVTRAQMATIAYRWIQKQCEKDATAFDSCSKLTNIPEAKFNDVANNHWASEAINFAKVSGLMVGDEINQFRPDESLTRAQAVTVLNQLFQRGPLTNIKSPRFIDVPKTHWAFGEIEEAAWTHQINYDVNGNEILK